MNCQLTPHGCKPVVAIDECQVLDEVFGWGGFRSSYGNETWTWLTAALDPKWAQIQCWNHWELVFDIHCQDPHVQCQPEIVRLIRNVSIAETMNIFLYKNVVVQCKIGLDRN